jgi:pimeloyl-ACP methyl ester carboxylesterase
MSWNLLGFALPAFGLLKVFSQSSPVSYKKIDDMLQKIPECENPSCSWIGKKSQASMKAFLCLIAFCVLGGNFSLFADRQDIRFTRADGTVVEGYFDRPDSKTAAPVVVFIDGSHETSVTISHDKLAARFNPRKIGLISLEKRGITPEQIDQDEFRAHDCFEERLQDYVLLLKQLKDQKIPGCNGRIVLLGGSEGGKIAPRLSLESPTAVQGLVLIGSGGGLLFGEEMKFQSRQLIQQMGTFKRLSYKVRGSLFPNEIEQYYEKMLGESESLEMCGPKTWKWFASYLRYDLLADLLKAEVPIYMIHGEQDMMVPIKSADLVQEAFDQAGKTNLQYARYDDLGHALTGREDVYAPMLDWISDKSFSAPSFFDSKAE